MKLFLALLSLASPWANGFRLLPFGSKRTNVVLSAETPTSAVTAEQQVRRILDLGRELGPVGSFRSKSDQKRLAYLVDNLPTTKDTTTYPLPASTYNLVYSDSTGGSSGRLAGPLAGEVTQEIVDDELFINAVRFGPLDIALTAKRETLNDSKFRVRFLDTEVSLFGRRVTKKEIQGGGDWDVLWVGKIDGKLVRIMKAPSIFVLEEAQ